MATGNTIGRMVGQSPAKKGSVDTANPIALLSQGLQQLVPMWQQLQGMIEQLAGGGGGGGGGGGAAPAASEEGEPIESPEALRARLTELGARLRTGPSDMEGAPRGDQVRTRQITEAIAREALRASGPRGSAVHELTLLNTEARVAELARAAPSAAQAAQAVDNAATMARMRGAGAPVMQMLQKALGMFQQVLSVLQKVSKSNGAQIKKG